MAGAKTAAALAFLASSAVLRTRTWEVGALNRTQPERSGGDDVILSSRSGSPEQAQVIVFGLYPQMRAYLPWGVSMISGLTAMSSSS